VKVLRALILCVAIALLSYGRQMQAPVVGQRGTPTTRSVEGTVLDRNGAPVPGAIVLLKDTKTLQVRSYIASKDGKYHFYGLSSEINYELRAQANGFTSARKNLTVFNSHQLAKLDLKLKSPRK
jgi:Carboxypeptidase regulatory-like domain